MLLETMFIQQRLRANGPLLLALHAVRIMLAHILPTELFQSSQRKAGHKIKEYERLLWSKAERDSQRRAITTTCIRAAYERPFRAQL